MAGGKGSNYSVLVDIEFTSKTVRTDLQKTVDEALKGKSLKAEVDFQYDGKSLKDYLSDTNNATESNAKLKDSIDSVALTYQEANAIFNKSIEIMGSMLEQVYNLDAALIEYQKVSDLSGQALDNYVDKLRDYGSEVARTGWNHI